MRRTVKSFLFMVLTLALVSVPAFAGQMSDFPKAGEYTINSHPSFTVTVGSNKELVECNATLLIRAGDPYITKQGTRRVDLTILDWKATGTSKLLGGQLNFRAVKGTKIADESFVETYHVANASNGAKDFPAKAQFAIGYELDTPFGTVTNLTGVTRGTIRSFPPKTDTFLLEKGDVAKVMAQLLPAQLSSVTAAGEVNPLEVTITAEACGHDIE
jgi:hypothetical protein